MEIHCDLAVAVVTASSGGAVPVGLAAGTAWTYASGDWESCMGWDADGMQMGCLGEYCHKIHTTQSFCVLRILQS